MRQKNNICLFFIVLFIFLPFVSSKSIIFTLDQKEYYFKVGNSAIIPLHISSNYGKQIDGHFTYTYAQTINQGGMSFSSSNTQSTSFAVPSGDSNVSLDFGTSSSPSDLKMSLHFSFNDGDEKEVRLGEIIIHFVSEDSQVKNEENEVKSSSKKVSQSQSQSSLSQQMQKKMEEMLGNSRQEEQSTQQKLLNNQMGQDSSALKNQMQKEMAEEQQMRQEFQNAIAQNERFQEEHQSLLQQGYNLTSGNINPISNNSGSFDLRYQKITGETAELKGSMENGEMKNIQKLTSQDEQRLMKQLEENKDFKKFNETLGKEGFNQTNSEFKFEKNETDIKVNYRNTENKTSAITAKVIDGNIEKVALENNNESKSRFFIWLIFFMFLLGIIAYFIYRKFYRKQINIAEKKKEIEKPFDYLSEAKKLIEEGKKLFNEEKFKDAYSRISQAARLYLSYKNGIKKEITNDEIISYFKKQKKEIKDLKEFFDLCSMVEFAKYKANKSDFDWITDFSEKMIKA